MLAKLSAFFAQDPKEKKKCQGYAAVDHKESIHLITPVLDAPGVTEEVRQIVKEWCFTLDSLAMDLLEALAKPVFYLPESTVIHFAELPIGPARDPPQRGMFDIAHYLNRQTVESSDPVGYSTKDVNCVPHYDPGFLSISFLSTHDGLQLQDPKTGAWFAGPVNTRPGQEDLGVIWLGEAAQKGSKDAFRPGIHRVVYPKSPTPRTTAWYEMCTIDQVENDLQKNDNKPKKNLSPAMLSRHSLSPLNQIPDKRGKSKATMGCP